MTHWTDEKIERDLRAIVGDTGRLPSASELRATGHNRLVCAVTRRGGLIEWANRLGVTRAFSDSDFGWQGEDAFVRLCSEQGLPAVRSSAVKAPWDIVVASVLRVDVKNASLSTYGHVTGWFYQLGKQLQADIVVLYQHDTGNFFALPWWACPATGITISRGGGKYAQHMNNWPMIRAMTNARLLERYGTEAPFVKAA